MNGETLVVAGPVAAAAVAPRRVSDATTEPAWVRRLLIGIALAFLAVFLFVPLVAVFVEALKKGVDVYLAAISEPDAVSAIKLTLLAAAISVPLNLVFGIAAAWSIAKFDFRGKNLLLTFIDLPFSVSPVIAGNLPLISEITPLLIITKLEQFDVAGATAIAVVMLVAAFAMLLAINGLQAWTRSRQGR